MAAWYQVGLACATSAWPCTPRVHADDRESKLAALVIEYEAPASCPKRSAFERALAARLYAPLRAKPRSLPLRARFEVGSSGVSASVAVRDTDGRARERTIAAKTCREAVEALALITALALQRQPAREGAVGRSPRARPGPARAAAKSAREFRAISLRDAAEAPLLDAEDDASPELRRPTPAPGGAAASAAVGGEASGPDAALPGSGSSSPVPGGASLGNEATGPESGALPDASRRAALQPAARVDPSSLAGAAALGGGRGPHDAAELEAAGAPAQTASLPDFVAIGGWVATGIGPQVLPGVEVVGQVRFAALAGAGFGARVAFRFLPAGEVEREQGRARFGFVGGAAGLCAGLKLGAALAADGCGLAELGALFARGLDTRQAASFERPWIALGPALHLGWIALRPLQLQIGGDLLFPAPRDRYRLADEWVHRVPASVFRASVSLGITF